VLTILNVAYPFAPVDSDPVGGAEQVVSTLDRALVAAGHRSCVVAHAASRTSGCLIPGHAPAGPLDAGARAQGIARYRQAILERLSAGDIDLVHLHGVDFAEYLPDTPVPVLVTLHLPLAWYPPGVLVRGRRVRHICVSRSQRASARALGLSELDQERLVLVENGVPLDRYRPHAPKEDFALLLGRICPEKGFDVAIRAAREAGARLLIAGAVFPYPEHERYFREVVTPLLDDRRQFVGAVAGATKRELLARARCVLIPSQVDETSSLVAMEALASGTPVVAFRRGALPEVVDHGQTGFIVEDERQMADSLAAVDQLRSGDCRAAAEARFSAAEMTRRYFALYEHAAAESAGARRAPRSLIVEEIVEDAALEALAPAWGELADASPRSTPFQRPEWLLAARRHLPGDATAHALAVRRGADLVALLPLERTGDGLTWIGAGVSDYLDLICAPGDERAATTALTAHLEDSRQRWGRLDLGALRPDSPLLDCPLPAGWRALPGETTPSPVMALPGAALPERLAYDRRRLGRAGEVRWRKATAESARELIDALLELHAARWGARGEPGVLAHPAVQAFHREAAPALARRGLLRMHGLELGGRLVGVLYGLAEHGRTLFYLSGFDPALSHLSPGVLLVAQAIEAATAEGCFEFDFLRGREPYKYAWGAVDRSVFRRQVWHG
jgi:CelD/BcsL family acetyltransferase involved in cellulose biosynthesis/glycosyltransferase involved in cell wall biosynthesis